MATRFRLRDYLYAHRGLWADDTHPENSLEAILAAGGAGLGCELDVRPAACGTPVVFHDAELDRMTGTSGLVAGLSAEEMTSIPLNGGGTIPTLEQVLDAWTFDTPILIELKIDGETDAEGFTALCAELVERFEGKAAMMSFSRRALSAIPDGIMKGALILPSKMSEDITLQALVSTSAALGPDYIGAHVSDAQDVVTSASDYGLPVAIYTVADAETAKQLSALPVAQIFEGFDPAFAGHAR